MAPSVAAPPEAPADPGPPAPPRRRRRRWLIALAVLVPLLAVGTTALVVPPAEQRPVHWVDDFDGTSLNNRWVREKGSGYGIEKFSNDPALTRLDGDGHLVVSAVKDADGKWRGGMLSTRGKFAMTHGTVEIRAKLPTQEGAWPAMWWINDLYGKLHSEIDLMELFPGGGSDGPGTYFSLQDWTSGKAEGYNLPPNEAAADGGWHVWRLKWTPSSVALSIDGKSQGKIDRSQVTNWVWSDVPLYLVFDMAVGAPWNKSLVPAAGVDRLEMEIDYVQVHRTG